TVDTFKRLKSFYWPYKKYLFRSLFFLLFVTGITVVYPMVLQITLDDVVLKDKYSLIPILSIVFIVLMFIKGISTYLHQYLGDLFGIIAVYKLREALYSKLQRLSFKYYDNAKTGDLMSRLTADVDMFRFFLSVGFAESVRVTLLILFSLAVMFFYSFPF